MQVVTIRAVVKVDLVEHLCCHANDGTVVVPSVTAAANYPLAQGQRLWAFVCCPRLKGEKPGQRIRGYNRVKYDQTSLQCVCVHPAHILHRCLLRK